MAEVKNNIITHGMSGNIGGQVVFKQYGNRTIVSKMPDMSKVVKSEKQKAENRKFSDAIIYARGEMANPHSKAEYKAKAKGMQKPHNVAIADFYNPPEIRKIDTSGIVDGKSIIIHAWDDFKVVKVSVEMHNSAGNLIEQGEASELREWFWEYEFAVEIQTGMKIRAFAWDKPGNKAEAEIII